MKLVPKTSLKLAQGYLNLIPETGFIKVYTIYLLMTTHERSYTSKFTFTCKWFTVHVIYVLEMSSLFIKHK